MTGSERAADPTPTPAWMNPTLGDSRGVGNDRPRGPAESKRELDPGLAVVRFAYDNSRVDQRWSAPEERGYAWWAQRLRQRIWSEPGLDDEGIEVFRIFVRTDLVRGVTDTAQARLAVDAANAMAAGSALIVDAEAGTVSSVASMWVHEQTREWVARTLSVVAAIQVAQAHALVEVVALLTTGEPDVSAHPTSGLRPEPDEMLGLLDLVKQVGQRSSAWANADLVDTLGQVRGIPIVTRATGDESGMTLEVPYRQTPALIRLDTREAHPALGHGLLMQLSLPGDAGPGPDWAALRNQQETESLTRSHFLGSWVGSASFPTFVAFYPNLIQPAGMSTLNIILSTINRVRWLAELGRSGTSQE
jgi:hypothetical protein